MNQHRSDWWNWAAYCALGGAFLGCSSESTREKTARESSPVTLTPIGTPFTNPVGIDCHVRADGREEVVMSVNYFGGEPFNFVTVAPDGTQTQFSAVHGLTDEVKIATVRDTLGGFNVGDLFVGTGVPGVIGRVSADGSAFDAAFATLPGEGGLMRGSLYVDRTGVFGGDLIAVTTNGGVWRVDNAGNPTHIVELGVHLEGLSTVPNDPVRYGPWAGTILAGAEQQFQIWSITPDGVATPYELGFAPEDIDLVPPNENLYTVDFAEALLLGAPASDFTGMVGDLLFSQEVPGLLIRVTWDGTAFVTETVADPVPQFEHKAFCGASIVGLCGNGAIDPGEECDDGNNTDGDGCSAGCLSENRPPVAVCHDVTASVDASCQSDAAIDFSGSSDPDGDTFTCVATPAGPYSLGTTAVTVVCTDSHGASGPESVCTGTVTLVDTTPPVFKHVPHDIKTCDKTPHLGRAKATDNCGPATVTNDAPDKFACGLTVVTYTATDAAGNTTTATQRVVRKCGRECRPHHRRHHGHGDHGDRDDDDRHEHHHGHSGHHGPSGHR